MTKSGNNILDYAVAAAAALNLAVRNLEAMNERALDAITEEFRTAIVKRHSVFVAGNGGSASLAEHFVAELVGRFEHSRSPLSALALTANTANITALSNDFGYEAVFARQVQAHARPGDILIVLSSSGESRNLLHAVVEARRSGALTIGLLGRKSTPIGSAVDYCVAAEGTRTANTQELHLVILHALASLADSLSCGHDCTMNDSSAEVSQWGAGHDK